MAKKSIVKLVHKVTRPTGLVRGNWNQKGGKKRIHAANLMKMMRKGPWKRGLDNIPGMKK